MYNPLILFQLWYWHLFCIHCLVFRLHMTQAMATVPSPLKSPTWLFQETCRCDNDVFELIEIHHFQFLICILFLVWSFIFYFVRNHFGSLNVLNFNTWCLFLSGFPVYGWATCRELSQHLGAEEENGAAIKRWEIRYFTLIIVQRSIKKKDWGKSESEMKGLMTMTYFTVYDPSKIIKM